MPIHRRRRDRPMRQSLRLVLGVAASLAACGGHAATTTATPVTVDATFAAARGGDTIVLAPGDYLPFHVTGKHWDPPLTVDAKAARLAQVAFNATSGVAWHGGTFDGGKTYRTGWSAGTSDHITVDGLTLSNYIRNGIVIGESSDIRVSHNVMIGGGSDGMDIALSRRVTIDHNECREGVPTPGAHPDCIQLWSRPTAPPVADITITDNRMSGDTQGITMFNHIRGGVDDGGFDRIRIENNYVRVKQWHGIALWDCRDCVVRNNRVDAIPNGRVRAWIKVVGGNVESCGNIASAWGRDEDKRCRDRTLRPRPEPDAGS